MKLNYSIVIPFYNKRLLDSLTLCIVFSNLQFNLHSRISTFKELTANQESRINSFIGKRGWKMRSSIRNHW